MERARSTVRNSPSHRKLRDPFLLRLGRSTARHPLAFVLTWLVLVVAGFAASLGLLGTPALFDRLESGPVEAPGQALTASALISATDDSTLDVVLRVDGAELASPELTQAVAELVDRLGQIPGVGAVHSPMTTQGWPTAPESQLLVGDNDPVSGRFLITVGAGDVPGSPLQERVTQELESNSEELLAPHADQLQIGGTGLLIDDIVHQMERDLATGEGIALPLSLLLMVFVFGGFVAAGMPIVGAIASISGALTTLLAFSVFIELDVTVVNIVTVMGLALCIDYGLLLVSRFREELARIAPAVASTDLTKTQIHDAVGGAVATAGRTILFSALIVGISLSGLLIFEAPLVRAIGAAGVSTVVLAMLVALTLVPALCALGARRLGRRKGAEAAPEDGVFSRLARLVQKQPVLIALAAVLVLLALAAPALGIRLNSSGAELLPVGAAQRVFYEEFQRDFPALATPTVTVVAQATPEQAQAWATELAELPGVTRVNPPLDLGSLPPDIDAPGADPGGAGLVSIELHTAGGEMGDEARDLARTLRDQGAESLESPGFPTWVTGSAASLLDFNDSVRARAVWAALWIGGATFILLFLLTGSVVIPIKALILNVVSLGASLGILVWAFQDGHLESLLNFTGTGGIESVIPLLVLAFGFGLSMDYEVFLLARIIELHEQGYDDDTAVRLGLQRSGRIITSAALIMVIVFAGFAAGQMLVIKQTGFALAVAVAIDATIVRMVIVPATMTMMGRWNWWAPAWLKRIHAKYGVSEHSSPITRVHQTPISS